MPLFGADSSPKIRFQAHLQDNVGTVRNATIWNSAAREVLQKNGSDIAARWEGCAEENGSDTFLEAMNKGHGSTYEFQCELCVWETNQKNKVVQVNVNSAMHVEIVDDEGADANCSR